LAVINGNDSIRCSVVKKPKVGVLAGGMLGLNVLQNIVTEYRCEFILTDNASREIVAQAQQLKIPYFVGNPRGGAALKGLKKQGFERPDILVSVNYPFLIDDELISLPHLLSINIHGSLLPRYRGRAPLIWAIINGDDYSGITVHAIETGCDTGPVLLQQRVEIPPDATGAEMVALYSELYPGLILEALSLISSGNYILSPQDDTKATFYGKRTPDDGLIDWSWCKERIYNWVRALAPPYPGAFCFVHGEKIIIEKVGYSDYGFSFADENGCIIGNEDGCPVVKTSNGAIRLDFISVPPHVKIEPGDLLMSD